MSAASVTPEQTASVHPVIVNPAASVTPEQTASVHPVIVNPLRKHSARESVTETVLRTASDIFKSYDTNNDGIMDSGEFGAMCNAEGKGLATFGRFKKAAGLRKGGMSIDEYMVLPPPEGTMDRYRWHVAKFAESQPCRIFFISLVFINGIIIGIEADYPSQALWSPVEYVFVSLFTVEIAMKLIGFGALFWTEVWNVLDFFIVLASLVDLVIKLISGNETAGLSVLRMIRVFRIIRLVGFLEKLNLLVQAFMQALQSVAWVMVLVVMVVYIFAVLGQGFFGEMYSDPDKGDPPCPNNRPDCIEAWFGTVTHSMLSLFQVMTLDSWGDMARVVGDQNSAAWIYFVLFMALAGLGLMNLLTAVFVEALIAQTKHHERMIKHQKEMARKSALDIVAGAFEEFDTDGDGRLDAEELKAVMASLATTDARKTFESLGLPVESLLSVTQSTVDIISEEEDGGIDVSGYADMLHRIDNMHMPAEKANAWEINDRIHRLERAVKRVETDVSEILTLLKTQHQAHVPPASGGLQSPLARANSGGLLSPLTRANSGGLLSPLAHSNTDELMRPSISLISVSSPSAAVCAAKVENG